MWSMLKKFFTHRVTLAVACAAAGAAASALGVSEWVAPFINAALCGGGVP